MTINKRRMYRLTYKVHKAFPTIGKKHNQRIFTSGTDIAIQVINNKHMQCLMSEFGFTIQLTIQ